ncbi:MAG: peptide chain release factor N(5)-glutamine methyltransferase [Ruthenibacterium sp.]
MVTSAQPCDAFTRISGGTALCAAWRAAREMLTVAGVQDAAFDATQLLRHATGLDRRVHPDAALSDSQAQSFSALVRRRAAREPLQYLLGTWDFLDFTLAVGPGVLIPRADTEIVAQTAIEAARRAAQSGTYGAAGAGSAARRITAEGKAESAGNHCPCVLDLCAGSGALAIGIARAVPQAAVTAVELSADALPWLRRNVAALAPHVRVAAADVFVYQNTLQGGCADVLVSNPPYITSDEMKTLAPELSCEPRMALEAGCDGLLFYRHIAAAYRGALRRGGALVLEIGCAQGAAVREILRASGYAQVRVLPDAAGRDRCVSAIAI